MHIFATCGRSFAPSRVRSQLPFFLMVALVLCIAGCDAMKSDKDRIVGKWKSNQLMGSLEFSSDGNLTFNAALRTAKGRWKLLKDSQVRLELEGLLWGTNVTDIKYEFADGKLMLRHDDGSLYAECVKE